MVRNSVRALAVLLGGLLVAGTWPITALPAGLGVVSAALVRYRGARLGMPYVVAGAVLLLAFPTMSVLTPTSDQSTIIRHPVRTCAPMAAAC